MLNSRIVLGTVLHLLVSMSADALLPKQVARDNSLTRKAFMKTIASSLIAPIILTNALPASAEQSPKLPFSESELKQIVTADVLDRQFLVTGNLTRSIYRPTATFTDEIDTYGMDQWMKGTQRLFVGEKSDVRLIGDVEVAPDKITFRFDEDLVFRIPFNPVVSLSGKVMLDRDSSGYITAYREFWDQDVATVLRTARF